MTERTPQLDALAKALKCARDDADMLAILDAVRLAYEAGIAEASHSRYAAARCA